MTRNRWLTGLFIAAGGAVLLGAVLVFALRGDGATPVSAEEIVADVEAQQQEILDALSDGGALHVVVENYRRDRPNPEGFLPPGVEMPDRTTSEVSIEVDPAGVVGRMSMETSSEDGTLLALESQANGRYVIEHPETGESSEFPAPSGDVRLADWLHSATANPAGRAAELGMERRGAGTLEGAESLIFERTFSPDGDDASQIHQVYEFSRENPIIARQSDYRVLADGSRELISELIVKSIEAVPN